MGVTALFAATKRMVYNGVGKDVVVVVGGDRGNKIGFFHSLKKRTNNTQKSS